MRDLVYIVLIAAVLWTGFAWENAHAPVAVIEQKQEEVRTSAPEPVPAVDVEIEEEVKKPAATQPGPLVGAAPKPPIVQKPIVYDEAYVLQLERAIHDRINAERVRAELGILAYDETLATIGAAHSTDMAEKNYFAHENEEGCDSACRVTNAGYLWRSVGENLFYLNSGYRYSVEDASAVIVQGWMGSEGHRHNVLEESFTHEGVGVVVKGDSVYATELMAQPR